MMRASRYGVGHDAARLASRGARAVDAASLDAGTADTGMPQHDGISSAYSPLARDFVARCRGLRALRTYSLLIEDISRTRTLPIYYRKGELI